MSTATQRKSGLWLAVLPLVIFLGLAGIFYSLLTEDGRDVSALPSALLNDPAPVMEVPPLLGLRTNGTMVPGIDGSTFNGKVSVFNVFASWCVPCRQEHPQIVKLGEDPRIQVVGLNHKDNTTNAQAFLDELGNPYDVVGVDRNGRAAIEWGVYGVPETFLVNSEGVIFYKHVGPVSETALERIILPLLEQQFAKDQ